MRKKINSNRMLKVYALKYKNTLNRIIWVEYKSRKYIKADV